jgi:hypothetical protein
MIRFQYSGHFSKEKGWTCGGKKGHEMRSDRSRCKPLSISEGYIHDAFWQSFDTLDDSELLSIAQSEGKEAKAASFALEARGRNREELTGKHNEPSYHLLCNLVESLSFTPDYRELVIEWTMGTTSPAAICYRKPWHRPGSALSFKDGRYRVDGELVVSGKQVSACHKSRTAYIGAIRIIDPADDEIQIPNVYPPLSKSTNNNGEESCESQG